MQRVLFAICLLFFASSSVLAYQSPFKVTWEQGVINAGDGQEVKTDIIIGIPEGHFIYKDKTDVSFTALEGVHIKSVSYPKGVPHIDPVSGKDLEVFPEGEAVISVTFHIPKDAPEGERQILAVLEFQGCEDKLW